MRLLVVNVVQASELSTKVVQYSVVLVIAEVEVVDVAGVLVDTSVHVVVVGLLGALVLVVVVELAAISEVGKGSQ